MKVSLHTLGCRLNQAETALIGQGFARAGYEIAGDGEAADICVINSCTVTHEADAKCRQLVRQVLRRNPETFVAVVGCYAQVGSKALATIDGLDLIVGTADKLRVAELIDEPAKRAVPEIVRSRPARKAFTIDTPAGHSPLTRANLKIQEGCDFMCSFCIIPFARGRARSRDLADIRREADQLLAAGHRELVLTGVNIGTYRDGDAAFLDVVDMLLDRPGLDRLRISSIEPTTLSHGVIDRMAADPRLCPHLHIPLQSGSDRVLAAMKRQHTRREFLDLIAYAHARVPDIMIATDLMVGFPGETDADFAETRLALADSPLVYAHIFRYSARTGTAAQRLPGAVDPSAKKERSRILHDISRRKKHAFHASMVGRELRVLLEERDADGRWAGFADNYVRVMLDDEPDGATGNALVCVRITGADDDRAVAGVPIAAGARETGH